MRKPAFYIPAFMPRDILFLSFSLSVRTYVSGICIKVLRQSFCSGVYLSNYLSESIHIWTIVTLEGWHSLHNPGPRGGARGQNLGHP